MEIGMMSDLPRSIAYEMARATPTVAAVATATILAQDLEFWMKILMYASATVLAVVQAVIAVKRWRRDVQNAREEQ